jgi:GAF domain
MPDPSDLQEISGRLERGEIDSAVFLDQLMRFVAAQIGCPRTGLRLLIDGPNGRTLRCVAMYDATVDRMIGAADISHGSHEPYFERLLHDGSVTMMRKPDDPVNVGALGEYLAAGDITAVMDMSFSVNGVLYGAFTCEQLGEPAEWTQRQLQALRRIASRASLTLMHVISMAVDTAPGALWETSTPNRLATMPMPLDPPKS